MARDASPASAPRIDPFRTLTVQPAPVPRRAALLFVCHLAEAGFVARFRRLETAFRPFGDAYFLYDTNDEPLPSTLQDIPVHGFSLRTLRSLSYAWLHDRLMPGHLHFPVLEFFRARDAYDHYWVIEYDVRFTGPWRVFFRWAQGVDGDLLATHIATHPEQPRWYWWSTLTHPRATVADDNRTRFFGPLYRLSRRALAHLDAALGSGWLGHQEVVIPTLLREAGMSLVDMTRDSSFPAPTWRNWYTRDRDDPHGGLKDSSMQFARVLRYPGPRPLTLYHPVKRALGHPLDPLRMVASWLHGSRWRGDRR
ncbi:hypothetical protein [Azohydromonas sediminis]|uniref:hypothetical protein n=1 Tax=Azohydromonas sediminis TaxID=2259674 RepID=UPI0013C30204|nr:hypothetical protein [Azohydromonas sediminis]